MNVLDRAMRRMGYVRNADANTRIRAAAFAGASMNRIYSDFNAVLQSADVETRGALLTLRARSRALFHNNDYAKRISNLLQQNVVGHTGIRMQAVYDDGAPDSANSEAVNREIERAWRSWERRGNPTTSGKHTFADVQRLCVAQLARDGEVFLRKVRGFPYNKFGYALQFIDPDRVDVNHNRVRGSAGLAPGNEIRMGIEIDHWERPVRYYVMLGHPSEGATNTRYEPVPAADIIHLALVSSGNQTRGIPLLHSAILRLHQLGAYEEAELVAARITSCMMAFFVSKTGEDFKGEVNSATGAIEFTLEPGAGMQLPEGVDVKTFNPGQPDPNSPEFKKGMLRGAAAGANMSYSSTTGDLREVNYSSIRQGVLDERDGYRMLQQALVDHLCGPVYEDWTGMALLTGQLRLPLPATADGYQALREACDWQARGWTWVDPLKDVKAAIEARASGIGTLRDSCADRGLDWREVVDQIALENDYAASKNVTLAGPVPANVGSGGGAPGGGDGNTGDGTTGGNQ